MTKNSKTTTGSGGGQGTNNPLQNTGPGLVAVIPRQGRNGFTELFLLSSIMIVFGVLLVLAGCGHPVLHSILILVGLVGFYVIERVSRPPSNDMHQYSKNMRSSEKQPKSNDADESTKNRRPVLLCLGDSITHGVSASGNFVDQIPHLVQEQRSKQKRGNDEPEFHGLEVINAGQNGISTHTILQERIQYPISCQPDYITILLGTNDIKGIYRPDWADETRRWFSIPSNVKFTFDVFEENLSAIVQWLLLGLPPTSKIALCTLPPMGEDLTCRANELVREGNYRIRKVLAKHANSDDGSPSRVRLVDTYAALEEAIKADTTGTGGGGAKRVSVDKFPSLVVGLILGTYVFGLSLDNMSKRIGNTVLSDCLHLNEHGAAIVAQEIAKWIVENAE